MSAIEQHRLGGYRCDTIGCGVQFTHDWVDRYSDEAKQYARQAAAAGWTFWISRSSRSSRSYCPDHGPRPGHKMREVTRR